MAYRNSSNRPAGPGEGGGGPGDGTGGGGSRTSSFHNSHDWKELNPNFNENINSKEASPPMRSRDRSSTVMGPDSLGTSSSSSGGQAVKSSGSLASGSQNMNAGVLMLPLGLTHAGGSGGGNCGKGGKAGSGQQHTVAPVYFHRDMMPSGPSAVLHQAPGSNSNSNNNNSNKQPTYHSRRGSQQHFQHRSQALPQLQHQHPHQHPQQRTSPPKYPVLQHRPIHQRPRLNSQSFSIPWQQQPYHHQLQQIASSSSSIPGGHGLSMATSPIPAQPQPIQLPEISDAASLLRACHLDPAQTFQLVKNIKEERDRLRVENRNLLGAMESMRNDFTSQRMLHERLAAIWVVKESLLWKFVGRVKLEKVGGGRTVRRDGDVAGGEWVPERMDEMWEEGTAGVDGDGDFDAREEDEDEEEARGRTRSRTIPPLMTDEHDVMMSSETIRTIDHSTRNDEHDVLSLTEGSTMSGGESMDTGLMWRLDPSATPFIPSPTRSTAAKSQRGGAEFLVSKSDATPVRRPITPFIKPAIPLSFRDVLKFATSPIKSSVPEAKREDVQQAQATKQGTRSNTSKHSEQEGRRHASAHGGKKGNKNREDRGGKGSVYDSMHKRGTATTPMTSKVFSSATRSYGSKDDSFIFPPPRKNREHEKPSPSRSMSPNKAPWSQIASKRRVSPEIDRVSNLPAYPLQAEPKPFSTIRKQPPNFLSRSRMNATLKIIPKPFDGICPFSLLSSKEVCHVKGCNLLHVCDVFNSKDQDQEFPPLGLSMPGSSAATVQMRCKDEDGKGVKQGEVCNRGIHVLRSCAEEIDGESCAFWSKKNGPEKRKSKKYQSLDLKNNYFSPIAAAGVGGDQAHAHPISSISNEGIRGGEDRDKHFKLYVHERDGVGRAVWDARVLNAGLIDTHACGLWGVDIGFGITGEDEDAVERARGIEWKGKSPVSVADSRGKGKGRAKTPSEVDDGERQRGIKWEEKKTMSREEWAARGEWNAKK